MNVLAGDFNASICMVVPKLRDRGIMIELAAGPYMFRSLGGEPQMDTCAIFFVGCPGQYARCVEMQHFHDQHAGGVLFQDASVIGADPPYINRTPSAVAEGGVKPLSLYRHDSNKFPGNPHKVFQPRGTGAAERLAWLFLPEPASEEAIAKRDADRRKREEAEKKGDKSLCQTPATFIFQCKETRLDVELVELDGQWHGGAHYPLMCATNFACARGPQGRSNRSVRKAEKRQARRQGVSASGAESSAPTIGESGRASQWSERRGQAEVAGWRTPAVAGEMPAPSSWTQVQESWTVDWSAGYPGQAWSSSYTRWESHPSHNENADWWSHDYDNPFSHLR